MSSGKSSNRKVREEARNKALQALSPRLLSAAEDVGEAEHEWLQAQQLAQAKAEAYRRAWESAKQNGWTETQLSQVVSEKPPRSPRGQARVGKQSRAQESTYTADATGEQYETQEGTDSSAQAEPSSVSGW